MKKSELKEMIKAAFMAEMDMTNAQDDDAASAVAADYDPLAEEQEENLDDILARITGTSADPYMAETEEVTEAAEDEATDIEDEVDVDVDVDAEEETTDGGEEEKANDSIVIDKKIVSLSSLPGETRKILDTLETLRAQAEEFGDQKFITQVGNTITFFTRDFVVAGDAPTMAKVDENNKQYYKDAEADDAEHIKALEKDMKDDKEDSVNELFGLFGNKEVKALKKKEAELTKGAARNMMNSTWSDKEAIANKLNSLANDIDNMNVEEYAKWRLNIKKNVDRFGYANGMYNLAKNETSNDEMLGKLLNAMQTNFTTVKSNELNINQDLLNKAAGLDESLNESIFPMWNKIK